jgi:hypothetical protein
MGVPTQKPFTDVCSGRGTDALEQEWLPLTFPHTSEKGLDWPVERNRAIKANKASCFARIRRSFEGGGDVRLSVLTREREPDLILNI